MSRFLCQEKQVLNSFPSTKGVGGGALILGRVSSEKSFELRQMSTEAAAMKDLNFVIKGKNLFLPLSLNQDWQEAGVLRNGN